MALKEFADCWRRYHRANAHYTAIAEQWRQLIEEEPYETSLKVDDDGSGRIAIYATYEPLPEIFGLELGEMLYQLRAALDHVIYATAVRETGQDPPPDHDVLEFPITMSPDAFQRAAWKIAPLSEEFRPLIEWVQPYNADKVPEPGNVLNTSLGLLHEWARIDRHRRLHVIGSWAAEAKPKLRLPEGVRVVNMEELLVIRRGVRILGSDRRLIQANVLDRQQPLEGRCHGQFLGECFVQDAGQRLRTGIQLQHGEV